MPLARKTKAGSRLVISGRTLAPSLASLARTWCPDAPLGVGSVDLLRSTPVSATDCYNGFIQAPEILRSGRRMDGEGSPSFRSKMFVIETLGAQRERNKRTTHQTRIGSEPPPHLSITARPRQRVMRQASDS
jgi:hypothetical protein